ncbi:D-2-hydroxyacid dehydrogenase [Paraburkholderia nemoris]|uniref:D-2-hydroxyacid dehydrogenase n=1 Tax=Paraburkholderia nemoris TaxID=2793076 RepID=UPI0038B6B4DE
MHIYVENHSAHPQYAITHAQVANSLRDIREPFEITVGWHATPDFAALARADCIVAPRFRPDVIAKHATRLRLVHCLNAGLERYLPLDWLPEGAVLTNSSGIHAVKAREYATMALLMLNTQIPRFIDAQRASAWMPKFTTSIVGKTVLIVGTGSIGTAIAHAAKTLGMYVTGVSRSGERHTDFDEVVAREKLDEMLPSADFVALACPLTDETRSLFSADRFASFKPGASFLNMSRGAIADTGALIDALGRGHLAGAVADVFDEEPVPATSPIWQTQGLIVTPHISCDSPDGYIDAGLAIFAANVAALLRGDMLRNQVDPSLQY